MKDDMKSGGSFTSNSTAVGPSHGIKMMDIKGSKTGDKIKSSYPMDNVHGMKLEDTMGGSFGGSDTNLSHSLKGASTVDK